ncbi:MAG: DNA polymerase III subunit epsilon [Emcibacter sp.]|nr:DNA polymerase III subunit epsilon [Emcibacter sp.]
MREIIFDTETTGFDPFNGDRLVEIGCIEVENYLPTGRNFHQYINPERDMPEGAFRIHGLSADYLKDFPTFSEIYTDFIDFIGDANLVAHNAIFDMKFINWELSQVGHKEIPNNRAVDTLDIARRKFPGSPNTLDALCKRFTIDNSNRVKHGALLDAELLAEVYLELMGGRQRGLALDNNVVEKFIVRGALQENEKKFHKARSYGLTEIERERHKEFIAKMPEDAVWNIIKNPQ